MWGEVEGCVPLSGQEDVRAAEPWRRICLYRRFRAEHVRSASEPERSSLKNTHENTVNGILLRCAVKGCAQQSSRNNNVNLQLAHLTHPFSLFSRTPPPAPGFQLNFQKPLILFILSCIYMAAHDYLSMTSCSLRSHGNLS